MDAWPFFVDLACIIASKERAWQSLHMLSGILIVRTPAQSPWVGFVLCLDTKNQKIKSAATPLLCLSIH